VLKLIYIFVVAKPILICRLALLSAVTLITTRCLYGIARVEELTNRGLGNSDYTYDSRRA
jgi:hypothetical protein